VTVAFIGGLALLALAMLLTPDWLCGPSQVAASMAVICVRLSGRSMRRLGCRARPSRLPRALTIDHPACTAGDMLPAERTHCRKGGWSPGPTRPAAGTDARGDPTYLATSFCRCLGCRHGRQLDESAQNSMSAYSPVCPSARTSHLDGRALILRARSSRDHGRFARRLLGPW